MKSNMNKYCILVMGLFSIAIAQAQTAKGDWLTGGSLFLSSTSTESNSIIGKLTTVDNDFSINAIGAYFITDNLATGVGLGWAYSASTNNYEPLEVTDFNTTFTVEALARYYYYDNEVFQLWVGAGLRFGFGSYDNHFAELDSTGTYAENNQIDKLTTNSIGIGPGAAIKLTPKLSLDIYLGSLGYTTYNFKSEDSSYDYKATSFGFSFAQNFGFGLVYRFSGG